MADSAINVGGECGLYRNTGTFGVPVWVEVLIVRDVTPAGGWDFVGAPSRKSPIRPYAKAELDAPHQAVIRSDITNSEYGVWVRAHHSRKASLDLLILNHKRTTIGAYGYRGPFLVSMSGEPQTIEGALYSTFELRATEDTAGETVMYARVIAGEDDEPVLEMADPSWTVSDVWA